MWQAKPSCRLPLRYRWSVPRTLDRAFSRPAPAPAWLLAVALVLGTVAGCALARTSPDATAAGDRSQQVDPRSWLDAEALVEALGLAHGRLLAAGFPSLAADRDALFEVVRIALAPFRVAPAFFDDNARLSLLFALAHRHRQAAGDVGFLQHAVYLLAREHLQPREPWPDRHAGETPDLAHRAAIYASHRDDQRSRQVGELVVQRDWLAPVREKLGLRSGQERPFRIVVVDFAPGSARAEAFAKALGLDQRWLPPLWSHDLGDHTVLAFTRPYAEQILAIDEQDEDERARRIALVVHEYIHSQDVLSSGELGLLFEEQRAERLSGSRHGYLEVKQFFIYLRVVTGFDADAAIARHPRDRLGFYRAVADGVGLDALAEIASLFPQAYLDTPNESMQVVDRHLGGRDGVLKRLLAGEIAAGREAAMDRRFHQRIDELARILGRERVRADAENHLAQVYRLPAMAARLIALLDADDGAQPAD